MPDVGSVTCERGVVITRPDILGLDPAIRWTKFRKEWVVRAIEAGLVTAEEVLALFSMSRRELTSWQEACASGSFKPLAERKEAMRRKSA